MPNRNKRVFLNHAVKLFNVETLDLLRSYFDDVEQINRSTLLNEREQNAVTRGEASDKARMQAHWYQVWEDEKNNENILKAIYPYTYISFPPQVRNVRAHSHKVPWHQDIGYMRLLGDRGHAQVITCFIPLEANPAQHTTLQFCLDNEQTEQEYPHVPTDEFGAGIQHVEFKDIFHYDLALGDALIFGDFTIHRTYTPPHCEINRRSLEFRLVNPQDAIVGKDYFDVANRKFIQR
ncbi:MAG TPA: phytanoyl-CoA dioxygenase family protein [Gammaproteobacteria bacterium]|jgi:hypothetical protein|nr:phytanoyl-CoA dioxygenase family protein [Gammaproteobacteria bacterium]